MRWLIIFALTVDTSFGQDGNFSGTVFDLQTGRSQVINGTVDVPPQEETTLQRLRRMNAELAESNARLDADLAANRQLYEMREQTRLLEKISKGTASGSSASYVTPSTYAPAPVSSYISTPSSSKPKETKEERAAREKRFLEDGRRDQAMRLAQDAKSFGGSSKRPRERQLSAKEGTEYGQLSSPDNEEFIQELLQGYQGSFTDYKWTVEKIDEQTYIVKCQVTLDGEQNEFRFRVNPLVGTCRYEGGTALTKLAPAKQTASSNKPIEQMSDAELDAIGLERLTDKELRESFFMSYEEMYGVPPKDGIDGGETPNTAR